MLHDAGYATAMLGKWHLGTTPGYFPTFRGFDQYRGLPYSDDMGCTDNPGYDKPMLKPCPARDSDGAWTFPAPVAPTPTTAGEVAEAVVVEEPPPGTQPLGLPLHYAKHPNCSSGAIAGTCDGDIEQQPVVLQDLSVKYDNFSASFIADSASKGQPFLLYAAFTHVHVPQYAGPRWANTTDSIFQDALAEVDNSVGVIMQALQDAGVAENTVVVLTGDNGPWESKCNLTGSKGPFKGEWQKTVGGGGSTGKFTLWEGGHRMAGVARWPGHVPAGSTSKAIVSTLDMLPTFAAVSGATLPPNREFDGIDITPVLLGNASAGHDELFHPLSGQWGQWGSLDAVRHGDYKAIYLTGGSFDCQDRLGSLGHRDPPLLFNLAEDPAESTALDTSVSPYKEIVAKIAASKAAKLNNINTTPRSTVDWKAVQDLEPCCDAALPACRCA